MAFHVDPHDVVGLLGPFGNYAIFGLFDCDVIGGVANLRQKVKEGLIGLKLFD